MNEKERAAMQQALEALEAVDNDAHGTSFPATVSSAITDLRAALAQQPEPAQEQATGSWRDGVLEGQLRERERWLSQEQPEPAQEPVAWAFKHSDGTYHDPSATEHSAGMVPLGPIRAQRPPLTEGEIAEATAGVLGLPHEIKVELARAIERKVRGE